MRDYKARSPTKLKTRRRSPSEPIKHRLRSKSPSQNKIIKLKRKASDSASGDDEDFNTKIQRSRLKSVTANVAPVKMLKKSRSRSRSPLTSAATKKQRHSRESDGVLDARELINRKRAMSSVNEPVTREKNELGVAKTTISGGKMVRIRDRESSKENCRTEEEGNVMTLDDDWPENGTDIDCKPMIKINKNGTSSKIVIRSDSKRNVVVPPTTSPKSTSPSNRRVDLRGLKRTVYIDEDTTEKDENVGGDNGPVETLIVDVSMSKNRNNYSV